MPDDLASKTCTPCREGADPLDADAIAAHLEDLHPAWEAVEEHHIERAFDFEDFAAALEFVNAVGGIAEQEGHHPVIEFTWGSATVRCYTHKIDGLHENDFILAAKIDDLYRAEFG